MIDRVLQDNLLPSVPSVTLQHNEAAEEIKHRTASQQGLIRLFSGGSARSVEQRNVDSPNRGADEFAPHLGRHLDVVA